MAEISSLVLSCFCSILKTFGLCFFTHFFLPHSLYSSLMFTCLDLTAPQMIEVLLKT